MKNKYSKVIYITEDSLASAWMMLKMSKKKKKGLATQNYPYMGKKNKYEKARWTCIGVVGNGMHANQPKNTFAVKKGMSKKPKVLVTQCKTAQL